MGFLNPLKAIGKGLSKLPGAKTLNKPINKALGKTPGLKSVPGKLGMAEKKPSPIAPTPAAGAGMVQDKVQASAASPGGQMSPPPQMQMPQQMPPMQAPMQMQEAPEAVMGANEMQMQPPPQPSLGPWNPDPNSVPQELRQPPPMAQQPNPQMGGAMNPNGQLAQYLQRTGGGFTGGMKKGIGPRFMG